MLVLDDWEGLIRQAPGTARLRELADVTVLDAPLGEVADADLADVRVLLAIRERTQLDAAALARLPCLDVLLQTGGHAYHVDAEVLRRRGVPVALSRRMQANRPAVAELTVMLAIACLRRLGEATRQQADRRWSPLIGRTLTGRRLGILGLGRHGRTVAGLGAAFRMDVVAWDRTGERDGLATPSGRPVPDGVTLLPLDALLATSDVVTVHLKLSDESRGLLDRGRLSSMKPGAVLVNTSRGAVVDEAALVDVLTHGPLAAAGLDVLVEEPPPHDHPLWALPNVVLTPHVGWTVEEVFTEFAAIAADQLDAYLQGRLARDELLDPDVTPGPGSLGGLTPADP
ncbi:MAG: NAD(P)-dependent oxidoreductase [Actinomycetes bacterium]